MTSTPIYGIGDGTYKTIGGEAGVRELVDRFYSIMAHTKDYQPLFSLHPNDDGSASVTTKDKLSRFLMAWMGGERTYHLAYGSINIPAAHAHLDVTPILVSNWLNCMSEALTELGHDHEFNDYLISQLAIPAERMRIASQRHKASTT